MTDNKSSEAGFRSGFVSLVGRPNVGKSTLMNRMVGQKIAITSNKPQTTRGRIKAIYTDDECQIVFLDTPGIHRSKNKLGEYMVNEATSTFAEADVLLWLVEPSSFIGGGERRIMEELKKASAPVILVMNKMDTVSKEELMRFLKVYSDAFDFDEIVPVSALKGKNTDTLTDVIKKYLPYGPPFYDPDAVTDQPERQITAEIIREKALRSLEEEIPHGIAVVIEKMGVRRGARIMDIEATIICEKESHKGIVIGKHGAMLKKIGENARRDIERMLDMRANLQLWVKVKKDWRDSDYLLKNFGYDSKAQGGAIT